jgi:hypothetical protein
MLIVINHSTFGQSLHEGVDFYFRTQFLFRLADTMLGDSGVRIYVTREVLKRTLRLEQGMLQ